MHPSIFYAKLLNVIRTNATDVEVLTNLGKDRLAMGIDEDGIVQICDLLTGQYSDEEMAVLREYVCNAWDSHVAAGITSPVEVTLPINSWEMATEDRGHFLKIKDCGLGLSIEEIATVYSRYGKSTKDHTDKLTGGFGIGGKVGLVPSFGSFIITAVKDGEKAVVHVGRDESGAPVMDLTSATTTDEPNGVEIFLPVERHHNLRRKADNLFQFWPEGSVLVDGKAPERLKPKIEISPTMWIVEGLRSKSVRSDFIVMGGVPYPVQLDAKLADGHSLVIFVPIGTVMPAPSREALRMTPLTKEALARLTAEYDQAVKTTVQNHVNKAKNKAEAVKAAIKWRTAFAADADFEVEWRGTKIPWRFDVPQVATSQGMRKGIVVSEHGTSKLSRHSRQEQIYIGTLLDAVLVEGYNAANFAPAHKEKLQHWARSKGICPKHYVLTHGKLAHGWIDSSMRVTWEEIRQIKITHIRGGGRASDPNRIKGSYDMWRAGSYGTGIPASSIPQDQPIFYHDPKYLDQNGYSRRRARKEAIFEKYPTATFVELTSNRVNKFCRDFPQARQTHTILNEIFQDFANTLTPAKRLRIAMEEAYDGNTLRLYDETRIRDPKLVKAIKTAKRKFDKEILAQVRDIERICGMYHDPKLRAKWENPLDAYPLASTRRDHIEHTYIYINAVYAAQENK